MSALTDRLDDARSIFPLKTPVEKFQTVVDLTNQRMVLIQNDLLEMASRTEQALLDTKIAQTEIRALANRNRLLAAQVKNLKDELKISRQLLMDEEARKAEVGM